MRNKEQNTDSFTRHDYIFTCYSLVMVTAGIQQQINACVGEPALFLLLLQEPSDPNPVQPVPSISTAL